MGDMMYKIIFFNANKKILVGEVYIFAKLVKGQVSVISHLKFPEFLSGRLAQQTEGSNGGRRAIFFFSLLLRLHSRYNFAFSHVQIAKRQVPQF